MLILSCRLGGTRNFTASCISSTHANAAAVLLCFSASIDLDHLNSLSASMEHDELHYRSGVWGALSPADPGLETMQRQPDPPPQQGEFSL
jgi:hypothetical protein